jgi:hypothetical protein
MQSYRLELDETCHGHHLFICQSQGAVCRFVISDRGINLSGAIFTYYSTNSLMA